MLPIWTLENVGPRIDALLVATKRTQTALADLLEVSSATVTRWRRGAHLPDKRSQKRLEKLEQYVLDHTEKGV